MLNTTPSASAAFATLDANDIRDAQGKADELRTGNVRILQQIAQKKNPDSRISVVPIASGPLLSRYADAYEGMTTGDLERAIRRFWELGNCDRWARLNGSVQRNIYFGGREQVVLWGQDGEALLTNPSALIKGREAFNKRGVRISQTGTLPVTLYDGECVDKNAATVIPKDPAWLPAIWCFCSSNAFNVAVRNIDRALKVTTATLTKITFEFDYWQAEAAKRYPTGLPEPYSDDPNQWLFHGHPAFAEEGTELHVALVRIAGYRWPAEADTTMRLSGLARERIALADSLPGADADGLLPLHANGNDLPLADRLRVVLAAAYGAPLSPAQELALIRAADAKLDKKEARDATLEGWLADRAFRQHCILFHQRPFLWQIWDGMKDRSGSVSRYSVSVPLGGSPAG